MRFNFKTYFPLILIFSYLIGAIALWHFYIGEFILADLMNEFMGGFFVIFSFFKILDLRGFAEACRTYDVIARKWFVYGYAYPFIELLLGVAYLVRFELRMINIFTLIIMTVSSVGVIQSLKNKNKIQCACLGTVFNLPMTVITFLEDSIMVVMALIMLVDAL